MYKSNYDKYPATPMEGIVWKGWENICNQLKSSLSAESCRMLSGSPSRRAARRICRLACRLLDRYTKFIQTGERDRTDDLSVCHR